jgi:hypothetical protein
MTSSPFNPRRSWNHALRVGGLFVLLLLSGCASYQYGQSARFPRDVQTVYVPMIESDSFRRFLGERLTEAVCKQIETDTPYKVINDPNADTVLYVRLVNDTKRLLVNNIQGDVRDSELNFQINVSWVNRRGVSLGQQDVPLPPELIDVGQASDLIAEYGRSTATQQQEIIDRLASRIVGLMEAAW